MNLKLATLVLFLGMSFGNAMAAMEKATAETAPEKVLSGTGFSDPNLAGNLVQTTLGLLLVLIIIAGAAWAFKRFGHFQTGVQGRMKVIGGISLGTRERVVLLQVGGQQLVVGVAPGTIRTLHVLDEPLPVESKTAPPAGFAARLQAAMAGQGKKGSHANSNESDAGKDV
jgi:flagellar protein FliO/FliZ